jgi:hypothetical protein
LTVLPLPLLPLLQPVPTNITSASKAIHIRVCVTVQPLSLLYPAQPDDRTTRPVGP